MRDTHLLVKGEHVYKCQLTGEKVGGNVLAFATSFDEVVKLVCDSTPLSCLEKEDCLHIINEALNVHKVYLWHAKKRAFIKY